MAFSYVQPYPIWPQNFWETLPKEKSNIPISHHGFLNCGEDYNLSTSGEYFTILNLYGCPPPWT